MSQITAISQILPHNESEQANKNYNEAPIKTDKISIETAGWKQQ